MDEIIKNYLSDGTIIFWSIIIQAIPFLVIGIIIALLAEWHFFKKQTHKPNDSNLKGIVKMSFIGMILPVCECGNIPLVKKMIENRVKLQYAITFLFAAPALNPLVILSTWSAFRSNPSIVFWRITLTIFIAIILGIVFSLYPEKAELITKSLKEKINCEKNTSKNLKDIFKKFCQEFIEMLAILIVGAFIATIIQLVIPREFISTVGREPVLSSIVMILFAFILSVCANVDAFIALSYSNLFSAGSLLAFLVFGPMIDLKNVFLMKNIFSHKAIVMMSFLIFILVFFSSSLLNIFIY